MLQALPILLLAAGASSRMRGRDKLLEDVGGQSLLRLQALRARSATQGHVIVTLPPKPHKRYSELADLNVTALPVHNAANGLSASLKAGLSALPQGTPAVLILLADLPEITTEDMQTVLAADLNTQTLIWRGVDETGKQGHPILVKAELFDAFESLTGDQGGQSVLKAYSDKTELIPLPDTHATLDLDTPEDWAEWRKIKD